MARTEYGILYPDGIFEKLDGKAEARRAARRWNMARGFVEYVAVPVKRKVSDWEPFDE